MHKSARPTGRTAAAARPGELEEEHGGEDGAFGEPAARHLGISRPSIYHLIEKSPRLRTATDLGHVELEDARRRFGDDVAAMADALEVSATALRRRLGQIERS